MPPTSIAVRTELNAIDANNIAARTAAGHLNSNPTSPVVRLLGVTSDNVHLYEHISTQASVVFHSKAKVYVNAESREATVRIALGKYVPLKGAGSHKEYRTHALTPSLVKTAVFTYLVEDKTKIKNPTAQESEIVFK